MEKSRVEPIKSKGIIPFVRNANDYQSWKRFEIATTYIRSKESVKGHRHPLVNLFSQLGNAWKMLQRIHRDLWKIFLSRHRRSINPCKYLRNIRATFSTFHFDSQHSYETVKICSRMCEWEVRNNFLNNFLSHVRFLFFNSIATIIKMKF